MKANSLVLALLPLLGVAPAWAQGGPVLGEERIEITPFAGYRTGGSFNAIQGGPSIAIDNSLSYGASLDYNLHRNNFKLELLFSRQDSQVATDMFLGPSGGELALEYYEAGVLQEVGNASSRWYISALVGATRIAPKDFDAEMHFAASIGGGLKFLLSKRLGLRFDGRAHATFVGGSSGAFCSGSNCVFLFRGSTFWQGDFTGGLILAF